MRDKPWYPVAYMFAVTAALSGILIGVSRMVEERVEINRLLFKQRAILMAANLATDRTPSEEVFRLIERHVEPRPELADERPGFSYRLLDEEGRPAGHVVPLIGRGFWDVIKGMLAVEEDRSTVIGIAFYLQSETPGLGARIEDRPFREQFEGKSIAAEERALAFQTPGLPVDENMVHSISGATQTTLRLERIINESLRAWRAAQAGEEEVEEPFDEPELERAAEGDR